MESKSTAVLPVYMIARHNPNSKTPAGVVGLAERSAPKDSALFHGLASELWPEPRNYFTCDAMHAVLRVRDCERNHKEAQRLNAKRKWGGKPDRLPLACCADCLQFLALRAGQVLTYAPEEVHGAMVNKRAGVGQ